MGVVYYGNYATYFEVARTDFVRAIGLSYREMEDVHRTMLPVVHLSVNYKAPAKYDDELTVVSTIEALPTGASITFQHEVRHPERGLLVYGTVKLVFVNADTMRPTRAPQYFLDRIRPLWDAVKLDSATE